MRLALALLLLLSQAVAQDDPRRTRLIGSVHGTDGAAWVGATVTLHSEPVVPLPEFGEAETLEVRTDDRGRFRVSLLRDRPYSAWAIKTGEDGFAVTAIARDVRPAKPLMLRQSNAKRVPVRVRVLGLAAWQDVGVPGLFVRDGLGRLGPLELDANGEADLGPLGGQSCYLEVCDARRRLLYRQTVQLTNGFRERDLERLVAAKKSPAGEPVRGLPDLLAEDVPAIDLERVLLGPPLRCRMRFVDEKDNKPIPRVEVVLDVHYDGWRAPRVATRLGSEHTRATADDQGRVELVVPTPISRWGRPSTTTQVLFIGKARGFELKQAGWAKSRAGARELTAEELRAGVTNEATFSMRKGFAMRGRVVGTARFPATAVSIVCKLPGSQESGPNSYWGFHLFAAARPDSRGEWEIHGVGRRSTDLSASLVLPPAIVEKLGREAGVPMSPVLELGPPKGGDLSDLESDVRIDPVDLAKLRVTDLEVTTPHGLPAQLASVEVHGTRWRRQRSGMIERLGYVDDPYARRADAFTDRRGRCRIITVSNAAFLLIEGAEHYAFEEITLAPDPAEQGPIGIVLKPYGNRRPTRRARHLGPWR